MRRQPSGFVTFLSTRLMSKQGSLRSVTTSSTCEVEVAFHRMSRETAGEVSSVSAQPLFIVDMVRREGGAAVN